MEIYRHFCHGRAEAFESHALDTPQIPAATGVGSLGEGSAFYLLAGRPGRHTGIENPRQTPAHHYPSRYGPKSPRFARATHVRRADGHRARIHVSGTAGILGHESVHPGDAEAQCRVALDNIARLIGPANLAAYGLTGAPGLTGLRTAKVYVRQRADMPVVRRMREKASPAAAEVVYLVVDLCRSELLVEIEAIADCPPTGPGERADPARRHPPTAASARPNRPFILHGCCHTTS